MGGGIFKGGDYCNILECIGSFSFLLGALLLSDLWIVIPFSVIVSIVDHNNKALYSSILLFLLFDCFIAILVRIKWSDLPDFVDGSTSECLLRR